MGSDGKYLYVDNFPDTLFTEGTKVHFRVYDESGTLFDDYTFPDEIEKYKQELELARPAPGGSDYQYFPFSDAETGKWGIHIFDKKQLGSLKGKEFEFTTVYGE